MAVLNCKEGAANVISPVAVAAIAGLKRDPWATDVETATAGTLDTCSKTSNLQDWESPGPPELPRFLPQARESDLLIGNLSPGFSIFSQVWAELCRLCAIAAPTSLANILWFLRVLISIMYLGRLEEVHLAGSVLAIGFSDVTGVSLVLGLASGMDAICSQAFGAGNYKLLQLTLQRAIIILQVVAAVLIITIWLNVERILLMAGQDPEIAAVTKNYLFVMIPDLVSYALVIPLRTYLRSQCITIPLSICACIVVAIHIPLNYLLIFKAGLGYRGAALAIVLTDTNLAVLLAFVIWLKTPAEGPGKWHGWSWECLKEWGPLLRLGVPSCLGICVEWWAFEVLNILAGLLPNASTNVAAMSIMLNCAYLFLMTPLGVSTSASTRVGFELGSSEPSRARLAAFVSWFVGLAIGVIALIAILLFGNQMAYFISNIHSVQVLVIQVMPVLGMVVLFKGPQYVGGGILRGCARPRVMLGVNLVAFYIIGLPLGVTLVFIWHVGISGFLWGLVAGQASACLATTVFMVLIDWTNEAKRAQLLVNVSNLIKFTPDSPVSLPHDADKLAEAVVSGGEDRINGGDCKWAAIHDHDDDCAHRLTVPLLNNSAEDLR